MKDWTDYYDFRITKAKTGYVVESSEDSEIFLLNEQALIYFVETQTNGNGADIGWLAKESMDAVGVFCFNKVG